MDEAAMHSAKISPVFRSELSLMSGHSCHDHKPHSSAHQYSCGLLDVTIIKQHINLRCRTFTKKETRKSL